MKLRSINFLPTAFDIGMQLPLSDQFSPQRRNSYKSGDVVTITSFAANDYGLIENNTMAPGIYENFRWLNVTGEHGDLHVPEHLLNAEGLERKQRQRAKIADLPETPFCEDDFVMIPEGRYAKIVRVDYLSIWESLNGLLPDGERFEPYLVETTDHHKNFRYSENSLKLVSRGQVYAHYNGLPTIFDTPEEEAIFHIRVGQYSPVMRHDGSFAFSPEQTLEMLESGEADLPSFHNRRFTPIGDFQSYQLLKFDNIEVGERLRTAYLETMNAARFSYR
jgi:hypothetical protein